MNFNFLLILVIYCSIVFNAQGATVEELNLRVKELEKQQADILSQLAEPKPQVSSFLNDSLTFGGFFEPGFTFVTGEDTDAQAFTNNVLALNLAAGYGSNFRFSTQILTNIGAGVVNPHNDPRLESSSYPATRKYTTTSISTTLVQGYIEYRKNRAFNVQLGLGYVPFGYAFQEREIILFHRRGGPQMIRAAGQIISVLWEGVHIHGSRPYGKNSVGYDVYTFSSPTKINTLGGGGRLWWASRDETIITGASIQSAKNANENYETLGADIKIEEFPWIIRSEFFQSLAKDEDPWSIYVEPAIYAFDEKILFYVFGDFLSNPFNKTNNILPDKYKKWEYGGGLNWLPTSYTRFRVGLTYNDYIGSQSTINGQNRDFWSLDLSAGVAF